jgi:predicted RNA binding protein YcfA (HicA-like mRNA interferase family)
MEIEARKEFLPQIFKKVIRLFSHQGWEHERDKGTDASIKAIR